MDPPPWPQTAGTRVRAAGPSVRPSVAHAIWYVGHQDTAAAEATAAQAGKAGQPRKEKEDETATD